VSPPRGAPGRQPPALPITWVLVGLITSYKNVVGSHMTYQAVPGACQIELFFTQDSQLMENVFHAQKGTEYSLADFVTLWDNVRTWVTDEWADVAVDDCSCVGAKFTDLSSETGVVYEPTLGSPLPGGILTPGLPTNVTVAVSWKTALRGRSYRGRTYHCGLAEESTLDSQLNVANIATITAAYEALLTHISAGGSVLSVVSRVNNKTLRAEGIATPVTSVRVDSNLDSQRRRLPGRGT